MAELTVENIEAMNKAMERANRKRLNSYCDALIDVMGALHCPIEKFVNALDNGCPDREVEVDSITDTLRVLLAHIDMQTRQIAEAITRDIGDIHICSSEGFYDPRNEVGSARIEYSEGDEGADSKSAFAVFNAIEGFRKEYPKAGLKLLSMLVMGDEVDESWKEWLAKAMATIPGGMPIVGAEGGGLADADPATCYMKDGKLYGKARKIVVTNAAVVNE